MKKWIIRIALGVVALLVVAAVIVFLSLNSLVKAGFEKVGPQFTKVDMRLEQANLSPLSGAGHLKGMFIGNPQGYKTDSAIKVGDAKMNVALGSLLTGTIVIESVNVQGPEITFEGGVSENNLTQIQKNVEQSLGGGSAPKPAEKSTSPGRKFRVKDMLIQGGKVNFRVMGLTGTIPLPDVHIQNIGTDGDGVNPAELTREIIKPLLASVTKVVTDAVSNLGKGVQDATKGAVDQVDKTTKGITDIFKKKK